MTKLADIGSLKNRSQDDGVYASAIVVLDTVVNSDGGGYS